MEVWNIWTIISKAHFEAEPFVLGKLYFTWWPRITFKNICHLTDNWTVCHFIFPAWSLGLNCSALYILFASTWLLDINTGAACMHMRRHLPAWTCAHFCPDWLLYCLVMLYYNYEHNIVAWSTVPISIINSWRYHSCYLREVPRVDKEIKF